MNNENAADIMKAFHELALWSKTKDKTRRSFYRFSIYNSYRRVIDMLCKGISNKEILGEIADICDLHKFSPNNREEWKKFSLIDEKELDGMRDRIQHMKLARRMSEKDIKFLGYKDVSKLKLK